jgi:hypothetical protein
MPKFLLKIDATETYEVEVEAEDAEAAEDLYYNGQVEIQWDKPISGVETELIDVEPKDES